MGSSLIDDAEALQNLLVSVATGGAEDQVEFARLRQAVLTQDELAAIAPRFLQTCRSLHQFRLGYSNIVWIFQYSPCGGLTPAQRTPKG